MSEQQRKATGIPADVVPITVGVMLLILRRRAGMSLRELAAASGVSASTLSRIENDGMNIAVSAYVAAFEALGYALLVRFVPLTGGNEEEE